MAHWPHRPAGIWAKTSIKIKLTLTLGFIVLALTGLLYSMQSGSNFAMNFAYSQTSSYYNINELQQQLIKSESLFKTYVSNPLTRSNSKIEWDGLKTSMTQKLSWLETDPTEISLDQYFYATALQTGFIPYQTACDTLILMESNGANTHTLYAQLNTINMIYGHLLDTVRCLQTEALSAGQSDLSTLRIETQNSNHLFSMLALGAVLIVLTLVSSLIQNIVSPVLRLSEASDAIRDGNFDTPDIELPNRDELYTLAIAFNEMKHNMKNLFEAMQQKNEMEQQLHQKELESREKSDLLAQAQMQQLRSQINPHFLFNTLNIISRTARIEKATNCEKLILSLARLFRYGLKTDDLEVPLQREINIVNDYISIQTTRFSNRVALRWNISEMLDPETVLVPAFLLQPLVENAVIHGLEPKREGGVLRIRIQKKGTALKVVLTDNGVGMDEATLTKLLSQQKVKGDVSGIGVGNVRSRLALLHPGTAFTVQSRPALGTRICIFIPDMFER